MSLILAEIVSGGIVLETNIGEILRQVPVKKINHR